MRARRSQLDVAEPLAALLGQRDFHAALVAGDVAVLHALVLAAQALPIRHRTEDLGAEQAVFLRFEGAVVDRLRLGDLTVRPAPNPFRRSQTDADGIEFDRRVGELQRARTEHYFPPAIPARMALGFRILLLLSQACGAAPEARGPGSNGNASGSIGRGGNFLFLLARGLQLDIETQ